mmetsp:Transcript_19039/g.23433  ORF Transcript_19039/g.23433 Transcript_19039/m.23433 type:complete len:287 (+) Transcript_19039:49-909(+)
MSADTLSLKFYNSHDISIYKNVDVNAKDLMSSDKLKSIGMKALNIKGENIYLESGELLTDDICNKLGNGDSLFIHDGVYVAGKNPDDKLDICIAGPGAVGKSSITLRLIEDTFMDDYNPTVEDLFEHEMTIDGMSIKITILDMAGQEDFVGLRTQQMRKKNCYVLVYSLISSKTFEDLQSFYEHMCDVMEDEGAHKSDKPYVLVGNKCDLYDDIDVTQDMIDKKMKEWLPYKSFKTSAKTGYNVKNMIGSVLRAAINKKWPPRPIDIDTKNNDIKDNNCCSKCIIL